MMETTTTGMDVQATAEKKLGIFVQDKEQDHAYLFAEMDI